MMTEEIPTATATIWQILASDDEDFHRAANEAWDPLALGRAAAYVVGTLLRELREHGEKMGCGCGSPDWLRDQAAKSLRGAD